MDKETREFLTQQLETIDARFDKVDARFEAIDAKIDENFETVDAKFEGMQQHIDAKAAKNRRHFEVVQRDYGVTFNRLLKGIKSYWTDKLALWIAWKRSNANSAP